MKRALYDLTDEEFALLVDRMVISLDQSVIPFMFVGGIASQTYIASALCKKYRKNLLELAESNDFRVQDYLRATDDLDITLDPRKIQGEQGEITFNQKILDALKNVVSDGGVYTSLSGNHLVNIAIERMGLKRPVFRLGLDTDANDPEKTSSVNFYSGPEDTNNRWSGDVISFEKQHYFDFMKDVQRVSIPYASGRSLIVPVKKLEHLIATKIVRSREKDWSDVIGLTKYNEMAGIPVSYDEVRSVLATPITGSGQSHLSFTEKFDKFMELKKKL